MSNVTFKSWTSELNAATRGWRERQMWHGAGNDSFKIVHVNDGSKLCSIQVRKNFPMKKLKELFKPLFNIDVIGSTIHWR